MPIVLAFFLATAALVGLSWVPGVKAAANDRLITGPKSVDVPAGIQNPGFPASLTLNGSTAYNNKFSPDPWGSLHYPFFITYDLHFVHWLGRVDLFNNGPGNSLRQVRLWVSEDGKAWLPTGSAVTLRDVPYWERMLFPEVRARWVRLEIFSAHGSLPEFRQIAFYSSRPLPKGGAGEQRPLLDSAAGGDAVLFRTFTPTLGREAVHADLFRSSNTVYFYDSERIEIHPGPLAPGRYLFSFLFDETQPIARTMRWRFTGQPDELFKLPGSNRSYLTFRVNVPVGAVSNVGTLEAVDGPNAFFSGLWIYRRTERSAGEARIASVEAWPLAPSAWVDLASNTALVEAADRLRSEGAVFFHDAQSWYLDFRIPEGELAGGQPRFETLDLFFHDSAQRSAGFGPETLHLSVEPRDRGDGKPMVTLVPHLGGVFPDLISNLIDDPRYGAFDARIAHGRILLRWPRLSTTRGEGALVNLFVTASNRSDGWFLASRSTSPQDWAELRPFRFRETELSVTNRMIPGLTYDLIVRDPFTPASNVSVNLTEQGKTRPLVLPGIRPGSRTYRLAFTPPLRTSSASGERLRFDYGGKTAWADLVTGDDAVILLLGKDGASRDAGGWTEGERIEVRVRDRDFAEGLSNRSELELLWDSGRLTRRETLPLEAVAGKPGERRLVMTLPAVTNLDAQAATYRLTLSYRDLVGGSGFQEKIVEKILAVREKIERRKIKLATWTPLGRIGNEEVSVRLGAREVELAVAGAVYPARQGSLMSGADGWLLFVNEEPDRREALERWLYRRTFLLIPNGEELTNRVPVFTVSTQWVTNLETRVGQGTNTAEFVQWVAEWSTRRVPTLGTATSTNITPVSTATNAVLDTNGVTNEMVVSVVLRTNVASYTATNGWETALVQGGRWVTNRVPVPLQVVQVVTNVSPRPVTNESVRLETRRIALLRTIGGPETGKVFVIPGDDGSSWTIHADLVRPLGNGVLFNAMRFSSDGAQRFLAEPILGDPFRGLMLEVE